MVIVPTTYHPGKNADYELVVFTDDPDAVLTLLPETTWHRSMAQVRTLAVYSIPNSKYIIIVYIYIYL